MDIPRLKPPKRLPYLKIGLIAGGLVLVTILLGSLKPAAPSVNRETVLTDSVRRGEMLREVRGPGTLVPEQIRWISALTPARVERILAQPGDSVTAESVLMELSNPDVQIQSLEAQQQLTAAQAQLVNLRTTLESQRLTQQSSVAQARTAHNEARRNALVAETLAVRGLSSSYELDRARDQAEEARTRLQIEEQRLKLLTESMEPQLHVQQEQVVRLRAINAHRQNEVRGLQVRAGAPGVLQELPLQLGQWVTPGEVLARVVQPSRLKGVLRIPETQATDVAIGQRATIDTRNGLIQGRVVRIDPASASGAVGVDVALEGNLPAGARPELSVDGTIEIERLPDVLWVGRPAFGQPNSTISLFRVVEGGDAAVRVQVRVGRTSVNRIEIVEGLNLGDEVILSDMSRWDNVERVRLK
ncbi:MAG TPA: HlyD family efflux transporter periplasmic adaptor subunit [Gemmatimonadales bacterium]